MKTSEELETFMLKHGENIIDTLGAEVDRLEKELKVRYIYYNNVYFSSTYSVRHYGNYITCILLRNPMMSLSFFF